MTREEFITTIIDGCIDKKLTYYYWHDERVVIEEDKIIVFAKHMAYIESYATDMTIPYTQILNVTVGKEEITIALNNLVDIVIYITA